MVRLTYVAGLVLVLSALLMAGCDTAEMDSGTMYDDPQAGDGGAQPTEPTEPSEPSEPAEPSEPTEPTEPIGME
ncbi:MAG: hypothetical protein ACLFO2_02265 [Candidatus Woesearchaeota archaeon]